MARPVTILAMMIAAIVFATIGWALERHFGLPKHMPLVCHETQFGKTPQVQVQLTDQFPPSTEKVTVGKSKLLCMPLFEKKLPKGMNPTPLKKGDHLVCFRIDAGTPASGAILNDQFGKQQGVRLQGHTYLCEPADKAVVPPET